MAGKTTADSIRPCSAQLGDQSLKGLNGAALRHVESGKTLGLFRGSSGSVEYIGSFSVDNDNPYYRTDAPETEGGPTRSVIVFRLRTLDGDPPTVVAQTDPAIAADRSD